MTEEQKELFISIMRTGVTLGFTDIWDCVVVYEDFCSDRYFPDRDTGEMYREALAAFASFLSETSPSPEEMSVEDVRALVTARFRRCCFPGCYREGEKRVQDNSNLRVCMNHLGCIKIPPKKAFPGTSTSVPPGELSKALEEINSSLHRKGYEVEVTWFEASGGDGLDVKPLGGRPGSYVQDAMEDVQDEIDRVLSARKVSLRKPAWLQRRIIEGRIDRGIARNQVVFTESSPRLDTHSIDVWAEHVPTGVKVHAEMSIYGDLPAEKEGLLKSLEKKVLEYRESELESLKVSKS